VGVALPFTTDAAAAAAAAPAPPAPADDGVCVAAPPLPPPPLTSARTVFVLGVGECLEGAAPGVGESRGGTGLGMLNETLSDVLSEPPSPSPPPPPPPPLLEPLASRSLCFFCFFFFFLSGEALEEPLRDCSESPAGRFRDCGESPAGRFRDGAIGSGASSSASATAAAAAAPAAAPAGAGASESKRRATLRILRVAPSFAAPPLGALCGTLIWSVIGCSFFWSRRHLLASR
jgi:hypothetical protein